MRINYERISDMFVHFDPQAPQKATNLSVNSDLLKKTRELDIYLSAVSEQSLAELVKARERDAWLLTNQEAIVHYNDLVDEQWVCSVMGFGILMRQFEAYENKNPATQSSMPFLMNLQADFLDALQTCVVVSLLPAEAGFKPIDRLMPVLPINGRNHVMLTPQLAGIARRNLGTPVADLSEFRDSIIAATAFLVTRF